MADKDQLSLANGAPPQFPSGNILLPQSNFNAQNQVQVGRSLGMEQNLISNQSTKPTTSTVNGPVPGNTRPLNWMQQSVNDYTNGAGDSVHKQQQSATPAHHLSPLQTAKPNLSYPGNMNPLSSYPSVSQVNSFSQQHTVSPHASASQMQPNVEFNKQNINKPSPVIGSKSNIMNTGGTVPSSTPVSGNTSQPMYFPQMNKGNPPVSQYSGASSISGQFPSSVQPTSSQVNKPLYGPPTSTTLPPKSSPFAKPVVSNSLYSNYLPPSSTQGLIQSPQLENLVQGSQVSSQLKKPQNPTLIQPFPQPNTLSTQIRPNLVQQPSPFSSNPIPKTPSLNTPLAKSTQNYLNSENGLPTSQSQYLANRDIGPPPIGMVPPPTTVPRPINPAANRLPLPNSAYGSAHHSGINSLTQGMEKMSVTQQGFNKLWGMETIDLLQCRNVLPPQKVTPPPIRLHQEFMDNVNCSPEIFCCTLNKIPETNSLLQKSRLPLGILIHPFRDLSQLAVIQCSSIVRCRACRTYINPFVYFVDNKRWKCNLCFRINELPDEFQYDPVSKTYGDPSRRPEIKSSTIEFIAPSEYMVRPPQPAIYLFVLDVSRWGCDSGYLETLCSVLLDELDNIPGDSRTQIGFILFDSTIHFFSIAENYNQAHEMIVSDIDDVFLPTPDSLLVNLNENRQLIKDLLHEIPRKYAESFDTDSALGPALQAAYKLMSPTGGRITVFQSCLPNKGPGSLSPREDPNQRSSRDVRHLGPQTDFYKRLSLDCSTQQISVDLFLISSQYSDLATLGGISQFSGGCIYHFPLFRRINSESNERLARALRRYLTRKIGFEAVMRVRCSRGLSIHTFHGNFFVRSTDLLSLPNVNPDAGFGMQIAIEDSLFELQCVCFQAALLYTSAKGERRIRVHTLCLPVSSNLGDILTSADQQAIVGLLGKMAVDRSLKSTLSDAREAFINVAIDILSAYKLVETSGGQNTILAPVNLSLIPLYILALLKSTAFQTGQSTRLDDRIFAMSQMKTLPLRELIQLIHPDLYHVTHLDDESGVEFEDKPVPQPSRLSLSSEHLDSRGAFLLDTPEIIYLLIGKNISIEFLVNIFNVKDIRQINKDLVDLPELENEESEKLRHFINLLQADKPWPAVIKVVTEPSALAPFLINDKSENAFSYYELLHHVKAQLK